MQQGKPGYPTKSVINIGDRFVRLTVIGFKQRGKWVHLSWICRCDCGNTTTVRTFSLRNGDIVSCGCYRKEVISKINRDNPRRRPQGREEDAQC